MKRAYPDPKASLTSFRKFAQVLFRIGVTGFLLLVGALAAQKPNQAPQHAPPQLTRAEMARIHAGLYKYEVQAENLRELAARTEKPSVEVRVWSARPMPGGDPSQPRRPYYPHPFLVQITRESDAVIVGVVRSSFSQLTEDEKFVFTDHEVYVEEVLLQNRLAPLDPATTITVTRPGGVVRIAGKTVIANYERLQPFRTGARYVFFFKFIPESGGYLAVADRNFELVETGPRKGVHSLTPRTPASTFARSADARGFIAEARAAVRDAKN